MPKKDVKFIIFIAASVIILLILVTILFLSVKVTPNFFTKLFGIRLSPITISGTNISGIRSFSSTTYNAGSSVNLSILVTPASTTYNYIVDECLPYGWTASNINNGGKFWSSGCPITNDTLPYVTWPHVENGPGLLSNSYNYTAIAPLTATGTQAFNGAITYDAALSLSIGGTMSIDQNVSTFNLTLNKVGAGTGNVVSNPSGISCSSGCGSQTASFNQGTNITLNATPNNGYVFSNWTGACSGNGSCTLTMNSNKIVNVTFSVNAATPLMIAINNPESAESYTSSNIDIDISLNKAGSCNYSTNNGATNISLTADSSNTEFTGNVDLANGNYILRTYCNDTSGNINSSSVSFNVNVNSSVTPPSPTNPTGPTGPTGPNGPSGPTITANNTNVKSGNNASNTSESVTNITNGTSTSQARNALFQSSKWIIVIILIIIIVFVTIVIIKVRKKKKVLISGSEGSPIVR